MGRIPPMKVKRELRQEVNFGCAICGAPLLEFHHIIPYSEMEHHDPDHMIALCPNHHRLSDDGAFSRSDLYDYKENPENSDIVDYVFYFDPHSPIIPLGSNVVEFASFGEYILLQVHGEPIISIQYKDGKIEFDVNFYNNENELIAVITENEWWADSNEFWDIKYQSNRLKLWNEKYEIGYLSEYHPENSTISIRGRFLYQNEEFIILPSKIKLPDRNSGMSGIALIINADEDYVARTPDMGFSGIDIREEVDGVFRVGDSKAGSFACNFRE